MLLRQLSRVEDSLSCLYEEPIYFFACDCVHLTVDGLQYTLKQMFTHLFVVLLITLFDEIQIYLASMHADILGH